MKPRVLTGPNSEIAEMIVKMDADIHEAIIFIEEPSDPVQPGSANGAATDIFAEMEPFAVRRGDADDSRDAIYRPMGDE